MRVHGGERPDGSAAPVVADPDCCFAAEVVQQSQHAGVDGFLAVVFCDFAGGGGAVARHVRGYGAESEGGESTELVVPGFGYGGPAWRVVLDWGGRRGVGRLAVDEDEERSIFWSGGEVVGFLLSFGVGEGVFFEWCRRHGGL